MKMHRVVMYVYDFEDEGLDSVISELDNSRCIHAHIGDCATADIGEWDDDHELNRKSTPSSTFENYFD